jgi:hypothetical protein
MDYINYKLEELWLAKCDGYWRVGQKLTLVTDICPTTAIIYTWIPKKTIKDEGVLCGNRVDESTLVRYDMLGSIKKESELTPAEKEFFQMKEEARRRLHPTYKELFFDAFPKARKHRKTGTPCFEACHVWPKADFECSDDCDRCWNKESR